MTHTEQNWTMENTKQLDNKQTKHMKNKRDIIKRQRQLTCQILEEIEQLWEEKERDRNEIKYLKKKTEQQQEDMDILTAQKDKQHIFIQRPSFQLENVIEKVQESESTIRQEGKATVETVKIKVRMIQEEMENLWDVLEDGEQQLEVTSRDKQELKTETGRMENMTPDSQKQRQDLDVSMKIAQSAKQDIEKNLSQVKSERDEIERIRAEIQTERESIERERQLVKAERESIESQKQELDDQLQRTKKEIREMEVMKSETEIKKNELIKMTRLSRRKKEAMSMMKIEIKYAKEDIDEREKTEGQRSKQVMEENMMHRMDEQKISLLHTNQTEENDTVNTNTTRVSVEIKEIRQMLRRAREDTEKNRRDGMEKNKAEKQPNKWEELEMVKMQIQRQREEVEQKMKDIIITIMTMDEIKINIEKVAAEMKNSQEEMLRGHRKIKEDKEEVKKQMVSHFILSCF